MQGHDDRLITRRNKGFVLLQACVYRWTSLAYQSPLPDPRPASVLPFPLESLVWPAAADAKLDGRPEGIVSISRREGVVFDSK